MKNTVRILLLFMAADLLLTGCTSPFSPSQISILDAQPLGFLEGLATNSKSISPMWSKPKEPQNVKKYELRIYASEKCQGLNLFTLSFGSEVNSASLSVNSNGNYSFSISTIFEDNDTSTSKCSDSIIVAAPAPPPVPVLVPMFPLTTIKGSGNYQFATGSPSAIAIAKDGNYLFGDDGNARVQVINPTTNQFVKSFTSIDISDVQGIEVDPNGNIFVISYTTGKVLKFDQAYNPIASGNIGTPVGLSLDSLGNVYVTSYTGQHVEKFDNNLVDLGAFVNSGLSYAGDSSFDSNGNMWLANSYASQIVKYNSTGSVLLTIGSPVYFPRSVAVLQNGNIAVSDASYITYIFDPNTGALLSQFAMPGSNPFAPWSSSVIMHVMPDGDMIIYYNEAGINKIGKFKINGTQALF